MRKLDQLLSQEMSRRDFLSVMAFGLVSILGISSIVGLLTEETRPVRQTGKGFGRGDFGH